MNRLYLFIILFGSVVPLAIAASAPSDCRDPKHVHKETKFCIYDISYPAISNSKIECEVRKWIDKEAKDFDADGDSLDLDIHRKNEFWITSDVFDSGKIESVVVENYQYAQGANGSTDVKTFTFDIKTGHLYELFDVLDNRQDWFKSLRPFIIKKEDELDTVIRIDEENSTSGIFKSFAIDNGELILCFDQEAVAAHSDGVVKIRIPLNQIKKVLKPPFDNLSK